jgi:translation initiation factor IF-3
VPVPRRFDRRPPERDTTRINERIRVPEVRLVDEDGKQIGVTKTDQAMDMARERDLDLVEVAPEARPPVARLLDYSKYKYEQEQKAKAARKHQTQVNVREIKLRPKIATHDYETKKGHVARFLGRSDKVKVTIMFRGREQAHPERGRALLKRLYNDVADIAVVEQEPLQEGRNMHMMLAPLREGAARPKPPRAFADPSPAPAAASAQPSPAAAEPAEEPAAEDEAAGEPEKAVAADESATEEPGESEAEDAEAPAEEESAASASG